MTRTFKKIDGVWCRLSACGFAWRKANMQDIGISVRESLGEVFVCRN